MATNGERNMNEEQDTQQETLANLRMDRRTLLGLAAGSAGAMALGQVARVQAATLGSPQAGQTAVAAAPSSRLLTPDNCALTLVDHQPQVALAIRSIDLQLLINNTAGMAEAAKVYNVPTILSTVLAGPAHDPIFPEIQTVFPTQHPIDRLTMNAWEDPAFVAAVAATGRRKLVMAGLWTEVCLAQMALSALDAGYEVYILVDVSGGVSPITHDAAVQRLVQAGAVPVTWLAVMSEWQRDYTRSKTLPGFTKIGKEHGGAVALGVAIFEAQGSAK